MKNLFTAAAFAAALMLTLISCEKEPLIIHGPQPQDVEFSNPAPEVPSTSQAPDTVYVVVPPQEKEPDQPAEPAMHSVTFTLLAKAQQGTLLTSVRVDINGTAITSGKESVLSPEPAGVYQFTVEDLDSDNVVVDLDYTTSEAKRFSFILSDYREILKGSDKFALLADLSTRTVSITRL